MNIADILGYAIRKKNSYCFSAWSHSFAAIIVYLYSKLNHLMENESYYADKDFRLTTLASAMNMSSHQLSELINVHFQIN